MPTRPEEAMANMIANLPKTTGKSMEEWSTIIQPSGLSKPGEIMGFLKEQHGLTHGFARQIAIKHLDNARQAELGDVSLTDSIFQGPKSALKPIYDALVAALESFGDDVDFAPKKGYVSVRRSKQFAILQPSAATRFDVGIQLKGVPVTGRLEASGSFNAMLSHRVRLSSISEVDPELIGWLRQAYDMA